MRSIHRSRIVLAQKNVRYAKAHWSSRLSAADLRILRELTTTFAFSVPLGDLRLLDGTWYVTHTGLLRLANRHRCLGIQVELVEPFCDPNTFRWVCKAIVFKSHGGKTFVGHGDADPSNVSPLIRGAEMRVAETRAVNRALRKAYGIGICSVEEIGSFSGPLPVAPRNKLPVDAEPVNGNRNHPLRDRLCLLIRQHQLDPTQVKSYAADFCDVAELRQASREQIATFIKHLAQYAQSDRVGLVSQLNNYARKPVCPAPASPESVVQQEKVEGVA